jgi:hypothetical protein
MTNHYNTLLLNIIYNNMKTNKFFLLCIIFALMISENIFAGDATISGNIVRKVTTTSTSASIPIRDCNGITTGTIPGVTNSVDAYPAYTAFTTVTIKLYSQDTSGSPISTIPSLSKDAIGFNTSTGGFSYTVTGIAASRYNYIAKVCLDAEVNSAFVREFTISTGSAIFPIGSVIAYMGNLSTVAGLEASGWYKCDGRAISSLNASLSGDEISAFVNVVGSNLPDLRGMFLRGLDDGVSGYRDEDRLTRTGGENTTGVRSTEDESMRKHTHLVAGSTSTDGSHGHSWRFDTEHDDQGSGTSYNEYTKGGSGYAAGADDNPISSTGSEHSHAMSFLTRDPSNSEASVSSYAGNENRPDNTAVYYLIRGR